MVLDYAKQLTLFCVGCMRGIMDFVEDDGNIVSAGEF